MKKFVIIVGVAFLTLFLTVFFYFSPATFIEIINSHMPNLNIRYVEGNGNILTGFTFNKIKITKGNDEVLGVNNVRVSLELIPIFVGRAVVKMKSDEVNGQVTLSLLGNLEGEITIKGLYFDTSSYNFKEDVQFSAKIDGKLSVKNDTALLEIRTDELNWRKLNITGIELPFTLFSAAKGGILFMQDKIVIKSINFEGAKGNARIIGEVVNSTPKLELEIIPKDWTEPYLIPLEQYKTGPGFYKISFSM